MICYDTERISITEKNLSTCIDYALLSECQLRARMGHAGREIVLEKFDLKRNVAQLMAAYGISLAGA